MTQLLSAQEVAQQLSFKTHVTVYRMVKNGDLPGVKLCRRALRIPQSSVDEYVRKKADEAVAARSQRIQAFSIELNEAERAGDSKRASKLRCRIASLKARNLLAAEEGLVVAQEKS
jgi:excisionase family DNA binding protein